MYRRDGGRCAYVDERGERCCETRYLEVHHLQAFAREGAHVASNLALRCRWTIDPPLWSVALEWQIYFVFAFVLLPLWRKAGPFATLAVAYAIGLLPSLAGYGFVSAWFLALFVLGMFAAFANFSPRWAEKSWAVHPIWGWVSVAAWLGVALSMAMARRVSLPAPLVDSLLGVATATFLLASTNRLSRRKSSLALRLLQHPASVKLGVMSYSLYLIHYPLLALVYLALANLRIGPATLFVLLSSAGCAVILSVTYVFHRIFERPFMRAAAAEPVVVAQGSL